MTIQKMEQELKQGNLNSLYLLYGEEQYLIENTLKKIKRLFGDYVFGINYIQIDETNINSLVQEIQMPSFGFEKKLIIIKKSGLFKKSKTVGRKSNKADNSLQNEIAVYIEKNIDIIKKTVVLVFIEDNIEINTLSKTIEKYGVVCNFEKLKPIQIAKMIKSICNLYKVKISEEVLQEFIEICGTNMQVLINEIRKLIEYAGEEGVITKEAIDLLSIKELDSIIFDLTDALGKKNTSNALEILHELIYNKEPVQKILVTLYNHFKKIYLTKLAIMYNINILEALKLKPNQTFLVSKYKMQSEYFSQQHLRKILQELIDLDYNYKQGNIDINIGLEAILCAYC